jgi:ribose/xylose/arabinose/galactoside ABC-type transport system permease subunit
MNVVIGALIVTLIPIGTAAIGVGPSVQSLVFGLIIIVSVILSTDRGRRQVNK